MSKLKKNALFTRLLLLIKLWAHDLWAQLDADFWGHSNNCGVYFVTVAIIHFSQFYSKKQSIFAIFRVVIPPGSQTNAQNEIKIWKMINSYKGHQHIKSWKYAIFHLKAMYTMRITAVRLSLLYWVLFHFQSYKPRLFSNQHQWAYTRLTPHYESILI